MPRQKQQIEGSRYRYLDVATAAELLLGSDWHRGLARVLGPHHPAGVRDQIDPRLVRRWAAGERPVPDWVLETLCTLLRREATAMLFAVDTLKNRPHGSDRQQIGNQADETL